jgi:hypothetical protein
VVFLLTTARFGLATGDAPKEQYVKMLCGIDDDDADAFVSSLQAVGQLNSTRPVDQTLAALFPGLPRDVELTVAWQPQSSPSPKSDRPGGAPRPPDDGDDSSKKETIKTKRQDSPPPMERVRSQRLPVFLADLVPKMSLDAGPDSAVDVQFEDGRTIESVIDRLHERCESAASRAIDAAWIARLARQWGNSDDVYRIALSKGYELLASFDEAAAEAERLEDELAASRLKSANPAPQSFWQSLASLDFWRPILGSGLVMGLLAGMGKPLADKVGRLLAEGRTQSKPTKEERLPVLRVILEQASTASPTDPESPSNPA